MANYAEAFADLPIAALLQNQRAVAGSVATGQLLVAPLAADAFGRWRFPGDRPAVVAFIASWLVFG